MSALNLDGLTKAQLLLYAVLCSRRVRHLMTDPRSVAALDVALRHLNGEATDEELYAAWEAAAAARDEARDEARDAAWAAADAAAWAAEAGAAEAAAMAATAAAWAAAEAAADAAAWDAARDAERAEQQKILNEIKEAKP